MFKLIEQLGILLFRALTGLGKFSKVMEISNSIFQDLESFGKERLFQNGYGTVLNLCLGKF